MSDSRTYTHRVELLAPETAKQDTGEIAVTGWRVLARPYARVSQLQGRTLERAKSFGTLVGWTVEMRGQGFALTAEHRIRYIDRLGATHTFTVNSAVDTDQSGRTLVVYCSEVVP